MTTADHVTAFVALRAVSLVAVVTAVPEVTTVYSWHIYWSSRHTPEHAAIAAFSE